MNLHLTDGTALPVDDGQFFVDENGDCFFYSDGDPAYVSSLYTLRLTDAQGEVCATWG